MIWQGAGLGILFSIIASGQVAAQEAAVIPDSHLKEIAQLQAKLELLEQQIAKLHSKKIKVTDCAYPANFPHSGVGTSGHAIDHAWNAWDNLREGQCPDNQVMVGEYSIHHNHFEDRMAKYLCCSLQLSD